jgi:hypothetical protein
MREIAIAAKAKKRSTATLAESTTAPTTSIKSSVLQAPAAYNRSHVTESDVVLEEPIFGLESKNRSWVERLKKINPAAYQNLKNWD